MSKMTLSTYNLVTSLIDRYYEKEIDNALAMNKTELANEFKKERESVLDELYSIGVY